MSDSPSKAAVRISDRPAGLAGRAVPGQGEGDPIIGGRNHSAIGALVERASRFTILLHLPGEHNEDVIAEAMITAMGTLPAHLRRSVDSARRASAMAGSRRPGVLRGGKGQEWEDGVMPIRSTAGPAGPSRERTVHGRQPDAR